MKKDYYIAPYTLKSQLNLRNLDGKIEQYWRNLDGWFIKIAKALKNNPGDPQGGPGADPVALMIAVSLFEAHGVLLQGKTAPVDGNKDPKSKVNFEYGFREFLSKKHAEWGTQKQEDIAERIYKQVRCGLFHLNKPKKGIWYYRGTDEEHPEPSINPKFYKGKLVKITFNVPALILEVEDYFQEYIADLRNPKSQYRKHFAEGWKLINSSLKRT